MVSINYSAREVCCKIVYYGPGLSGKTTNLQYVHAKVPGNTRGNLISLATEADRTLYFDFLPINIGTINGFAAKFQLYTVPGQVYYNATRKLVLRGVDGVVFVADSQPDKMDENIESLVNLEDNLHEYGYNMDDMPVVIQYNKRDLPGVLPVSEMDAKLNTRGWPSFEASATVGNGVFDTLKLIIKLVLEKAKSAGSSRTRTASAAPVPDSTAGPVPLQPESQLQADTAAQPQPPEQPAPPPSVSQPEPVAVNAEGSTPGSGPDPNTATGAGRQPSRSEHAQAQPQLRPFPGDQTAEVDIDQPTGTGEPRGGSGTQPEEADEASTAEREDFQRQTEQSPPMAPALRQRRRKRGFFKRLFGIK